MLQNTNEIGYLNLLRDILVNGERKTDRTGTGAISVFGRQLRFDLSHSFPLLTTKKVGMRLIISELLWILSGSTNANDLIAQNNHIWDEWADENGSLGPVYGAQWRSWENLVWVAPEGPMESEWHYENKPIDQISWLIDRLKTNPHDRGHVISAWNVADLPKMRLRPCHCLFQFYCNELTFDERVNNYMMKAIFEPSLGPIPVDEWKANQALGHSKLDELGVPRFALSCQLYQRSADVFLGVPFNIASYALLTKMIAQCVNMVPREFVHTFGDVHIYNNLVEQCELQLTREPYPLPRVTLNPAVTDIFSFKQEDFTLVGYTPHPAIKGEVSV